MHPCDRANNGIERIQARVGEAVLRSSPEFLQVVAEFVAQFVLGETLLRKQVCNWGQVGMEAAVAGITTPGRIGVRLASITRQLA